MANPRVWFGEVLSKPNINTHEQKALGIHALLSQSVLIGSYLAVKVARVSL
jgi:hypothetical protein